MNDYRNNDGADQDKESHYGADQWVELLEDETDPSLTKDLELLLENSKADRDLYAGLERTRRILKESDGVVLPESGFFYVEMHNRIMAAIEEEIEAPRAPIARRSCRGSKGWTMIFGSLGLTVMMALVLVLSLRANNATEVLVDTGAISGTDASFAVGEGLKMAALSNGMSGFDSESDFVMDAAAQRLQGMSAEEAEALLRALR